MLQISSAEAEHLTEPHDVSERIFNKPVFASKVSPDCEANFKVTLHDLTLALKKARKRRPAERLSYVS